MKTLASMFSVLALLLALAVPPSCASAPHSLDQLETMDPAAYASWLQRVRAWSEAAGYTLVDGKVLRAQEVRDLAAGLRVVSGQPTASIDLAQLAKQAGINGPLALAVVMEGQALIDARGGWPGGVRRDELLGTIAAGIEAGAATAEHGPPQP